MNKDDVIHEAEVVINTNFGGFGITQAMGDWLVKNKGWTVGEWEDGCDLVRYGMGYYTGSRHSKTSLRTHPDLVECVRAVEDVKDLKVVRIRIHLEVVDENDGIENVSCWAERCETEPPTESSKPVGPKKARK